MPDRHNLVLLPGLLLDHRFWGHQVAALSDKADAVIPTLTDHDSVVGLAAYVLEEAPPTFALCGLSMGGYVALEIMRQAPERVTHLALCDTSARPDSPDQLRRRRGLIELSQKGKFKGVTPRLVPLLIHEDRQQDEDLTGLLFTMAEAIGQPGFVKQQKAIMSRTDSREVLPEITCPTLVLCGRQDVLTPLDLSEEMAAAIPDAALEVVEHSGHLPPLERPDVVNDALRAWLDR
ncbi:MAG: alpha/beta fold hydrolase [Pseudomonadota bacterium]